jgi:uncharacterized protein involved in exopolysaccharide biosynthesis
MDTRVYPSRESTRDTDEIRIKDLVEMLLFYRVRVLVAVLGCTLAVAVVACLVPERYDAATVISAVSSNEKAIGGSGGAMSSLSGLAALAGMSVGNDSKKAESLATLQSQALTGRYIQQNNLLPILYAHEWDARQGKWKVTDPKKQPTLWKAIQFFKHIRTISTDTKTGLVTLTIRWYDPVLAAKWANGLVRMTNDYEREIALAETDRNKAYLTQQAAATDNVGVKQAIYNLLQSEISKGMIAQGTPEYAFKVIDPAMVAEKPAFPLPIVWTLVAFFGSLILTVFVAFCRLAWHRA